MPWPAHLPAWPTIPRYAAAMGAAARARIENELGWPHLARRYIRHFETMAARR